MSDESANRPIAPPPGSPPDRRDVSDPFAYLTAVGPVAEATNQVVWLRAMLAVEVALARAQADAGLIDGDDAAAVAEVDPGRLDLDRVFNEAPLGGNPVIPLVAQLRAEVGPDHADSVHLGATSQDVLDTATMLVVYRSRRALARPWMAARDGLAALAAAHAADPMMGRTLGQHARPTTFGAVIDGWVAALDQAWISVEVVTTPVQLGGPVGDDRSLGPDPTEVRAGTARWLGLADPGRNWHGDRTPILGAAAAWATAAAVVAKVAGDIVILTTTDVGELNERADEAGGSSSMPHKHNPVAAISARAAALQVPGLLATLFQAASGFELQRAAGPWHAEWPALHHLLRATGSAAWWLAESVDRLTVDPVRARHNLETS
ncbi:MAG: lyase family protein [Acidimicrobiales bacterium]